MSEDKMREALDQILSVQKSISALLEMLAGETELSQSDREMMDGCIYGCAHAMRCLSQQPESEPVGHTWDETGERCTRCGDKDWFAGSGCDADKAATRDFEQEMEELTEHRDALENTCDKLAARIADLTGADIGEHTSENCPWINALLAPAPQPSAQVPPELPRLDIKHHRDWEIAYNHGWNACREAMLATASPEKREPQS